MLSIKVVTSAQMRRIEARSEDAGVSTETLMENAGLEVARRVRHHVGHLEGVPILVLVGSGNNGGDGLVVARLLRRWGASVLVYLCRDRRETDSQLARTLDLGVPVVHTSQDEGLTRLSTALESTHVIVDAVLGTGRARPIEGKLKEVFTTLDDVRNRREDLTVLAIDMASGLDADTGVVDPACPRADITVALGYPKTGMFAFPGADAVGRLEVVDIGIPPGLDDDVAVELMTDDWASSLLPDRPSAAHKGSFGRTLVIAGSLGYIGAATRAASAATRAGAGLVTLAIPGSLQTAVAAGVAEPTYMLLPESSPGVVSAQAADTVIEALSSFDALLLGCGIGQAPTTREFVERLLYSGEALPPTVVDADALNILSAGASQGGRWWTRFTGSAILTPHPGEMARLTGGTVSSVEQDRIGTAVDAAESWNKVIALKGAYTVVGSPNGNARLSPFANPGLASAGTGDVLAGTIGGLLSQGLNLEDAAALGVYIHGAAGERVREELGDTGMIASDLLPALPLAIKHLRMGQGVL